MDELCNCTTMNSLRHTLDSLPKTLDETYHRILVKVKKHNPMLIQYILQCVCFFFRPPSVEEMGHIYRIGDRRTPPFDPGDALFHPRDAIDLCGGLLCLVSVDAWRASDTSIWLQDMEIVQLAHFSVKEYLLSSRAMFWKLDEELSHSYIVQAGIAYYLEFMASGDITATPTSVQQFYRKHSLATYCASFTSDHLSHLNPRDHPDLKESFVYLLDPTAQPTLDRKIGLWYFSRAFCQAFVFGIVEVDPLEVTTLRIATRLGLPMVCQWLLSINTFGQIGSTLTEPDIGSSFLNEAVVYCHKDVLEVFLAAGVDVNKKWRSSSPALHTAVWLGHREIVEVLINSGADINMPDDGETPVDLANARRDDDIMRILRDAGRPFEQPFALTQKSRPGKLKTILPRVRKWFKRRRDRVDDVNDNTLNTFYGPIARTWATQRSQ
jgi:hypothetical protein